MSALNSIGHHHHQEPALDKRNNNTIKMSAANYMTATTNDNSASPIDLIGSKFDELANKILNELKQSNYSREFFQAIDVILNEPTPSTHQQNVAARRLSNQIKQQQQQKTKRLKETTAVNASKSQTDSLVGAANLELKKQCELIMEKQRQQQEQLDNHQQILFDSQYRSLPAEITEAVAGHEQRRANAKALPQKTPVPSLAAPRTLSPSLAPKEAGDIVGKAPSKQQTVAAGTLQQQHISKFGGAKAAPITRSKENLATIKGGSGVVSKEQRQKSAIPQSISHKVEGAVYPITKSATVGGSDGASAVTASELGPSGLLGTGLVRQASLRLNKQTRETQQELIKQQTRPLAASEKLKQRRPTKASLMDRQRPTQESDDDLDDDGDDDDDDDEFEYQNLASRRAYLNQRFIGQQQQQQDPSTTKANEPVASTQAGRLRQQVTSTIQSGVKQASMNTANMTVAKQKQRFSNEAQVVRSNTIGGSQMARPSASARQPGSKPIDDESADQHEPRSLGGLLTSHDISQLYKPHMNYSTSLLGNHRLSDDDEIIIIPTAQSPSLMSASVSPVNPHNHHQHNQPDDEHPDRTTNNIDEFSERFSISRTKSFWEKLANSKSGGAGEDAKGNNPSPQHDKQYFNSSQRSLSSGPNLVADSKSSQCSLLNQGGHGTGQAANGHHYPAAMKSAFDRMDSTGGSGNSHYSGCSSSSSTSGDEQTLTGHMNLAERRSMLVSAATGANKSANRQRGSGSGGGGQPPNASMNPTINQLVQQDQINRSDRFRQTR